MTDKLKGDSGIRLQKEIAMGQQTSMGAPPKPAKAPRFKVGGAVNYQPYGKGMRKTGKGC